MAAATAALERLHAMADSGELAAFCGARGIDLLVVFGSAVDTSWPAAPQDLDLAVIADEQDRDWGFGALVADFIDLLHCDDVDVMDLRRAGVTARANALGGGIPLFENQPGLFAREQMAAVGQHMDDAWLTRLGIETLANR